LGGEGIEPPKQMYATTVSRYNLYFS
jgi:hypothetical protein